MSFFLAGPTAKTVYRNGERFGTIAIMPREPTGVMGNRLEVERLGNVSGHIVLCFKGPVTMKNVFVFLSALKQEQNVPTLILDFSGDPYIETVATRQQGDSAH